MKKCITLILTICLLASCGGGGNVTFSIENETNIKKGESQLIIVRAQKGEDAVSGMQMIGTLEMERMDHGQIKVNFKDNGDGTYVAEAPLAMGGEWIMELHAEKDGKTYKEVIAFEVSE